MAFTGERGPMQGPKMQQVDKGSGSSASSSSRERRQSPWVPVLAGQTSETKREIGKLAREGFKPGEVEGLLHTADNSGDARTKKRLRFTKWLYENGRMNEFDVEN